MELLVKKTIWKNSMCLSKKEQGIAMCLINIEKNVSSWKVIEKNIKTDMLNEVDFMKKRNRFRHCFIIYLHQNKCPTLFFLQKVE